MQLLKDRILTDGVVKEGNILKSGQLPESSDGH